MYSSANSSLPHCNLLMVFFLPTLCLSASVKKSAWNQLFWFFAKCTLSEGCLGCSAEVYEPLNLDWCSSDGCWCSPLSFIQTIAWLVTVGFSFIPCYLADSGYRECYFLWAGVVVFFLLVSIRVPWWQTYFVNLNQVMHFYLPLLFRTWDVKKKPEGVLTIRQFLYR